MKRPRGDDLPSRSSRRGRHAAPDATLLNWLTPDGTKNKSESQFASAADVMQELAVNQSPVREQSSTSNCTLFALWTASEVLLGGAVAVAPPFMGLKIKASGEALSVVHGNSRVQHFLASHGLRTRGVPEAMQQGHTVDKAKRLILSALETGVAVLGLNVSMYDDHTGVRSIKVQRNGGNFSTEHSLCVCGYCRLSSGSEFFITKDTCPWLIQGNGAVSLLPVEEAVSLVELFVVSSQQ
jgi:hypothetical protein